MIGDLEVILCMDRSFWAFEVKHYNGKSCSKSVVLNRSSYMASAPLVFNTISAKKKLIEEHLTSRRMVT